MIADSWKGKVLLLFVFDRKFTLYSSGVLVKDIDEGCFFYIETHMYASAKI